MVFTLLCGLIGFYDDLVELRWRYKIIIPLLISLLLEFNDINDKIFLQLF